MYKDIEDQEILYMIEENNDNYELIYEKYKPLIITICQKRLNSMKDMGYELDDLMQVANMALFEAVKTYKYDNDTKFYTYLSHCVNNALNLLLRNNLTNKKIVLNKAISYDTKINETTTLFDLIEDKTAINPYEYLDIEELKIKYINFINSLPFEVAIFYELKINGFTQEEIKTLMNINNYTYNKCLSFINQQIIV